jgi:MOSC domain-containing protein YiiM
VGTLLSGNVGMPKDVPWRGKTVLTAVFKDPVTGPRRVRKLNVDGDRQAHSDPDAVTGHAGLGDFEDGGADLVAVADADLVVA